MHGADELGNEGEEFRGGRKRGLHGTFTASRRAGNEPHLDVALLSKAEYSGDGVFLSATYDQPGDDVSDAHGPE
jgi:hypothetical protein